MYVYPLHPAFHIHGIHVIHQNKSKYMNKPSKLKHTCVQWQSSCPSLAKPFFRDATSYHRPTYLVGSNSSFEIELSPPPAAFPRFSPEAPSAEYAGAVVSTTAAANASAAQKLVDALLALFFETFGCGATLPVPRWARKATRTLWQGVTTR